MIRQSSRADDNIFSDLPILKAGRIIGLLPSANEHTFGGVTLSTPGHIGDWVQSPCASRCGTNRSTGRFLDHGQCQIVKGQRSSGGLGKPAYSRVWSCTTLDFIAFNRGWFRQTLQGRKSLPVFRAGVKRFMSIGSRKAANRSRATSEDQKLNQKTAGAVNSH